MKSHNVHFASRVGRVCFAIVTVLALAATSVLAQTTGQVIGTVVDAQGGVLPGVTVTLSGPAAMGSPTAVSNEQGRYRFPAVNSGTSPLPKRLFTSP